MYLISKAYQKVIISIELNLKTCRMLISYANSKEEFIYKTVNGDMPIEAIKHIRKIKNQYPYTYVATMSGAKNQGLISGNKTNLFNKFGLNPKQLSIMLINKSWFIYIGKVDIQKEKNKFSKIYGIDFIFSPFVVIYERVRKYLDSSDNSKKLYLLQEKYSCSLLIADSTKIYLGKYLIFEKDYFEEEKESTKSNVIEFDSLSSIDENIIIKDLDTKIHDDINTAELGELSMASHMMEIIKGTIDNFYNDDRYAGDFVEELLILDSYGISDNVISYLRDNIMIDIQFLQVDICEEILKLSKMELNL